MKLKKKKKIKGKDHGLAYMTAEEMKAMNAIKNSPGFIGRMARVGEQKPMVEKDGVPAFIEMDESVSVEDMQAAGLDYSGSGGGGYDNDGGGGGGGGSEPQALTQAQRIQKDFDAYKAGETSRNDAAAMQALTDQRVGDRQGLVDEYGQYKERMRGMEQDYDLSGERGAVRGYAGDIKDIGSRYDERMGSIADDYSGMAGYESDVAGLRSGMQDMARESMDRSKLLEDRGFYSGLVESARKGQQRGAEEQLMRGMAGAGSSPEQIALAKAKLQSGGEAARRDSLGAAQAAMSARQQQLSQGAGLMGQQAGLAGQAQGLGMNRIGAVGQTYGNMANIGMGAVGQQAGLQGQSAGLLTQQMTGLGQLMQGQVGMTDAQMRDVLDRDNMAFQERMADKQAEAQVQAAAASKPSGGGGGGGCCWIMLEARYGDGTMDDVVRRYRDEVLCPRKRRGYYRMAKVLVPLMRKSKVFKQIVAWTFADPLVAWGEWYYGKNKWGWLMAPIKNFWMGTLYVVGGETEFIRENGEVV